MQYKICYVLPSYSESETQHFAHIPRLLSEIGKYVDVYVIIEKCQREPNIPNVKGIYPQKYGYRNRLLRSLELAIIAIKLYRQGCKKFFIRISIPAGVIICILGKLLGVETYYWNSGQGKVIIPSWNSGFHSFFQRLHYEIKLIPFYILSKLVDNFVTGPESMKEYYATEYGVNPNKIIILYNDIDLSRFETIRVGMSKESFKKELNLPLDKKIVLFVGRVSPLKGGTYLIPIAEKIQKKLNDVIFVVIGQVHINNFGSELKSKGLTETVFLTGSIPNSEVIKYYLAADVFIMPSNSEGFPRVLLETMASGLPFVAFDVGGVKDIVTEKHLEYVVPRGNVELFSEKLIKLLENQNLGEELASEGLKCVQQFSTEKVAQMFIERIVLSKKII